MGLFECVTKNLDSIGPNGGVIVKGRYFEMRWKK